MPFSSIANDDDDDDFFSSKHEKEEFALTLVTRRADFVKVELAQFLGYFEHFLGSNES